MKAGIYGIRNIYNGKIYVGSAVNWRKRIGQHRLMLRLGIHHSRHLQHAWLKYTEQGFEFFCLEPVEDVGSLIAREQFWIDKFSSHKRANGYNLSPTAGRVLGVRHTEESRAKMAAAQKKRFDDPAQRAKNGEATKKGWAANPTARAKASERQKKRAENPDHIDRLVEWAKKRYEDPAERAKIAKAVKKLWEDPSYRATATKSHKKNWKDPAYRVKQSAAIAKGLRDPASRVKMSEVMKKRYQDPLARAALAKAGIAGNKQRWANKRAAILAASTQIH